MAIVIPSKNIYSINFDPVIDNQIDKVEFTEKQASIVESQEEVAKQTITNFVDGSSFTIERLNGFNDGRDINATYIRVTDIKYTPTITISVDKKQNNKLVKSLITGVDGNGNSNIAYELFGDVQKGQAYIELLVRGGGNNLTIVKRITDGYSGEMNAQDTTYSFSINNSHKYESKMEFMQSYKSASTPSNNDLSTKVEIDGGTLFSAKTTETDTQLSISFNLLVGFTLYKAMLTYTNMVGSDYRLVNINAGNAFGTQYYPRHEKYVAKRANITINGTVLSLNLEDDTIQKGNGNKVFSFDGNELIQTENTPTQESKYQEVIDEWKNGKQTAVITCPIADFYDENGDKVIDTSTSTKMLFDIGDIVIPYTYTNQGDKPIAYNKDFTPKQFKIVGTKISKNQGGTQELTLQEV